MIFCGVLPLPVAEKDISEMWKEAQFDIVELLVGGMKLHLFPRVWVYEVDKSEQKE